MAQAFTTCTGTTPARALIGALPVLCLLVSSAAADDAPASTGIEEIVVTAQKRSETLQSVPLSVTALTAATLSEVKMDSPSAIAEMIPSLQANQVNGSAIPVFSLRGVSMFDFSFAQSSPVASYFDEVYKGASVFLGIEMFDLDRVEVLRGPQGTLYGKNTTGGAINFIAKKPGFDTEGYLRVGAGRFNRREAEGAFQTALVPERVSARVSFTYTKADGWFHNVTPGQPDLEAVNQWAVRAQVMFRVTDKLDLTLRYGHSNQDSANYGILAVPGPLGIGGGVYDYYHALDPVHNPNTDFFRTGLGNDQTALIGAMNRRQSTDSWALSAKWDLSSSLQLSSISSYDHGSLFDPDGTDAAPIYVIRIPYIATGDQITQDLRVSSTGQGPFSFIGGLYYQRESIYNDTEIQLYNGIDANGDGVINYQDCIDSNGTVACRAVNSLNQIKNSWAAYTDASYALTDRLKVRGGLRYNHDNGALRNFISQLRGPDEVPIANLIPGDPNNVNATLAHDIHNVATTGKIGLDYAPAKDTLVYVLYSRGYRAGAFNAAAFFLPEEATIAKPETLDDIEGGVKTSLADGRLQLNGALFHYKYRNQQILDFNPQTAAQPLINLGESIIKGVELETAIRPVPSLRLRVAGTWLSAKFTDAILRGTQIAGNHLADAPGFSGTFSADWDLPVSSSVVFTTHIDGNYQSSQYFEVLNVDRLRQGAYGTANARLMLHPVKDQWEVAIWGRNLADKFYLTAAVDLSGFGFDYEHRAPPRMYGVDLTYRF